MTELWVDGLPKQLLSFVDALGPLVLIAGTLEAVVAVSRQTPVSGQGRDFGGIWRRYVCWVLTGLAITAMAAALSAALGRGGVP